MSDLTQPQAIKHDEGKARFDLIPPGPLLELAEVYTKGAEKYDPRNWEKGMSWGRIFAALMRHAWKWWWGEQNDPEDGISHMAHAAWGCFTLMEYRRTHPELDDRSEAQKPVPFEGLAEVVDQKINSVRFCAKCGHIPSLRKRPDNDAYYLRCESCGNRTGSFPDRDQVFREWDISQRRRWIFGESMDYDHAETIPHP